MQYIKHNQEFQAHYIKEIQPHLDKLETERLKSLFKFRLYAIIELIIFLILFVKGLFLFNGLNKDIIGIIMFFLFTTAFYFVFFIPALFIKFNFEKTAKNLIIPKILSYYGNFYYKNESIFSEEDLKIFNSILPIHKRMYTDDNIMGQKDNITIKITDIKCSSSRGKDSRETFKGLLIKTSFNKNFKGKTYIHSDGGSIDNFISKNLSSFYIELEDPTFEKIFTVSGTDQIEARYILTPTFMEKLLNLNSMASSTISCAFINQNMYLTFPLNKNSFETTSLFKNVYNPDQIFEVFNQLGDLFEIIEILKLNENIGL